MTTETELYENDLLANLDTGDHEAVLTALFNFAVMLWVESTEEPTEANVNRWARRFDPADKCMDRGMSVRTVVQNLTGAVDLLDDSGKALSRFVKFNERVEELVRKDKKGRR